MCENGENRGQQYAFILKGFVQSAMIRINQTEKIFENNGRNKGTLWQNTI